MNSITEIVDKIIDLLSVELKKVSSGELANNIRYSVIEKDFGLDIEIYLADYWKYTEFGRKPGKQPPIENIKDWIRVKHIVPRGYNNRVPSQNQLAYVISRSIGKHGTKGKHVISKFLESEELNNLLFSIIDITTNKIYEEIEDEVFK